MSTLSDNINALIQGLARQPQTNNAQIAQLLNIARALKDVADDEGTDIGDLITRLDAINPSANTLKANIIQEGTSGSGVTVDGALIKDGGISANSMFAAFYPTGAQQSLSGAGAINLTSYLTNWTTTGANAGTLAAGTQIGQMKKIVMVVDAGDGTLTLLGYTSIVFNDANDYVILMWNGTAWFVLENSGCTVNA